MVGRRRRRRSAANAGDGGGRVVVGKDRDDETDGDEEETTIDETHIELNIGISKDYNVFEFVNAISARNTEKAFKIIQYFEYNPKAADLTVIISNLFKFFSQIMRIHFLPNKSREAVAQTIGVHPFVAGELIQAKNQYDPRKIAAAIELLHRFDLKAKGVCNSSMSQGELLKELTYQILH